MTHARWRRAAATVVVLLGIVSCRRGPRAPDPREGDADGVRIEDVTEAAGIRFVHSYGGGEFDDIVKSVGGGIAVLDADGDGWMDLYLVNGGWDEEVSRSPRPEALPRSALWRNRGDGTFEDVTERAGVGNEGSFGFGAVAADHDGDGDTDIYVCNYRANRLYRNRGDGTFEDATAQARVGCESFSVHAVFLDHDRDGDLDLYVVNYLVFDPAYRVFYAPEGFPGPLAYSGAADVLYRNEGDGTFTDVTEAAGVLRPDGRGMSAIACDLDDDGWTDLFVANDAMENWFWRNRGDGTFENRAVPAGLAYGLNGESTAAMGADAADWDGDGSMDLFVPDTAFSCLYTAGRDARGLRTFRDRSAPSGVAQAAGQYTGWGGVFLDVDRDGLPDLFRANGNDHHLFGEQALLLRNRGDGRFEDVSRAAGPFFLRKVVGRSAVAADLWNEGRASVAMQTVGGAPVLLRNRTSNGNHGITLRLVGDPSAGREHRSPVAAIGARVRVTAGGRTQVQEVRAGSSYLSTCDPRPTFGLGPDANRVRIEVDWPSGNRTVLVDAPVDRVLEIRETAGSAAEEVR